MRRGDNGPLVVRVQGSWVSWCSKESVTDREQGQWVEFSDDANNVRRYDVGQRADNPAAVHASQFMPGAELSVTDAGRGVVELPGGYAVFIPPPSAPSSPLP